HRDRAWSFECAIAQRVLLQLRGQLEDLGLFDGRQVVVAQKMPGHDCPPALPAASRMPGSAVTKESIWCSVMIKGGANRMTSGAAALTRKPAARAAISTSLAVGALSTTPHSKPRPRTWSMS